MLLAYRENPSFCAVGRRVGVHHQTVQRCVERALAYGPLAAIEDRPRPGKEPVITPEAKAWLVSLACDKAKEHGYLNDQGQSSYIGRPVKVFCFISGKYAARGDEVPVALNLKFAPAILRKLSLSNRLSQNSP
jgi:hypothetical protein